MTQLFATIIDASSAKFWHSTHVGETFEVLDIAHARLRTSFGNFWIDKRDCCLNESNNGIYGFIPETHKHHGGKWVIVIRAYGTFFFCKWQNPLMHKFEFITIEKSSLILEVSGTDVSPEDILLGNGLTNPLLIS